MTRSAGPSQLSKSSVSHIEYFDNDNEDLSFNLDGYGDDGEEDREVWTPETSPISSDTSSTSESSSTSSSPKHSTKVSPPALSVNATTTPTSLKQPKSPTIHPYRPSIRAIPKPRTLMPLSTLSSQSGSNPHGLPKSQPLARALFARIANDNVPHAGLLGSGSQGKKIGDNKKQKLIVPTKPLRTTFELGLTASELARKC